MAVQTEVIRPARRAFRTAQLVDGVVRHAVLLLFALMVAIPIYWMVTTSIKTNRELYEEFTYFPNNPTLENFTRVIVREQFATNVGNSLIVGIATTALTLVISALAAFSIVRFRYRGRHTIGQLVLFKYLIPTSLLFIPLYSIVTGLGLGNSLQALVLTYLTFTVPFCTWMLMGYFRSIPADLEEQAMVDGSSKVGALARVLIPLSAPGLVASAIFSFTLAWNEFLLALVFINRPDLQTVPVKLAGMIVGDQYVWGMIMAGAILASVPVVALYFLAQRFVVAGLAAGAVKG